MSEPDFKRKAARRMRYIKIWRALYGAQSELDREREPDEILGAVYTVADRVFKLVTWLVIATTLVTVGKACEIKPALTIGSVLYYLWLFVLWTTGCWVFGVVLREVLVMTRRYWRGVRPILKGEHEHLMKFRASIYATSAVFAVGLVVWIGSEIISFVGSSEKLVQRVVC